MDDPLWNPFVVKMGYLFTEMEVLHQCRTTYTRF